MRPNSEFPADLVTFIEEILNRKLHFLCSVYFNALMRAHMECTNAYLQYLLILISSIELFRRRC